MKILIKLIKDETTYPHLLQVSSEVLALSDDGHIVKLPLLLGQQLEPSFDWALDYLTAMVGRVTNSIDAFIRHLIFLKGCNFHHVCSCNTELCSLILG